jgi:hypothetical protein
MRSKPLRVTDPMRSSNLATAARAYIEENNWPVVVLHGIDKKGRCTCGDRACGSPGKHPAIKHFPHGVKSATRDINLVKKALRDHPDANIAIVLEDMTGVDVDGPKGEHRVDALHLPATATILTGRGHDHLYSGELAGGSLKSEELDLLTGKSRYIVAPPSRHHSGQLYRWDRGEDEIVSIPPSLSTFAQEVRANRTPTAPKSYPVIREGERNNFLFKAASAFRLRVDDDSAVLEMIRAMNQKLVKPPLSDKEIQTLVASSGRYESPKVATFGPPQIREPRPMEFLWYPYIIRYGVTLLVGDPGKGKSLLVESIAATVSSGRKWPLSSENVKPGRVLFLSAEDDWARTTLPRLIKAGANIDSFHIMERFRALDEQNMLALQREMQNWRPDLVVIDTLSTFLGGGRDMHRQNEVMEFMADLTHAARDTGSAILAVAHMNKQSNEHPSYRIVGSIGFAAGVRSILYFGNDPEDQSRRALAHGKSNVAEKGKSLVFAISGGGRHDVPVLEPVTFSDHDETDICRVIKAPPGRPNIEQERAAQFVADALSTSPVPWEEVERRAKRASISIGTLNIVRAELAKAGLIEQVGKGRRAQWRRI